MIMHAADDQAQTRWTTEAWYQAAWAHEVKAEPLARTFLNHDVVLFRDADGVAHALEDRCCHRATPLRLGAVTDLGLQCGYHGVTFDGAGKCVLIPGQEAIPGQAGVRSYPVIEKQEIIWIWMGAPDHAEGSKLLVDFPWNDDHAHWPHLHDMFEVGCSYQLLIDNLMDLTHIPFIHRLTIGGGNQMGQVDARMEVTPTDTGVHYIRWMENIAPPPTYIKGAGFAADAMVDRWQEFEFVVPSTVLQWTGALEVGRGAVENRHQPGGFSLRLFHGVTPKTDTSCYYFWTPLNGYKPDDDDATKQLFDEIGFTFQEDVAFLEAQQSVMSAQPEGPLVAIKHDKARLQAEHALRRFITERSGSR